jgi:hypothetical protein
MQIRSQLTQKSRVGTSKRPSLDRLTTYDLFNFARWRSLPAGESIFPVPTLASVPPLDRRQSRQLDLAHRTNSPIEHIRSPDRILITPIGGG